MPGLLHQGILWLFEDDPWLAFDVLGLARPVVGTPIDRRAEAERDAPQLFRIHPYFPDLVLVYRDPEDDDIGIVMTIEGQVLPDIRKRYRIPVCQAVLADKHQLPTWAVVIALSLQTATLVRSWAIGPPPKVEALVLATDNVARVTSLEQARQRPALTALSAALHGCNGDLECVRVAIEAFRELSETQRRTSSRSPRRACRRAARSSPRPPARAGDLRRTRCPISTSSVDSRIGTHSANASKRRSSCR